MTTHNQNESSSPSSQMKFSSIFQRRNSLHTISLKLSKRHFHTLTAKNVESQDWDIYWGWNGGVVRAVQKNLSSALAICWWRYSNWRIGLQNWRRNPSWSSVTKQMNSFSTKVQSRKVLHHWKHSISLILSQLSPSYKLEHLIFIISSWPWVIHNVTRTKMKWKQRK